jgi:hypothetical protein
LQALPPLLLTLSEQLRTLIVNMSSGSKPNGNQLLNDNSWIAAFSIMMELEAARRKANNE